MKFIKRFISSLNAAKKWVRALELTQEDKFSEALVTIHEIEGITGGLLSTGPSVLKADLYQLTGQYELVAPSVNKARAVIDKDRLLSAADRGYLNVYLDWLEIRSSACLTNADIDMKDIKFHTVDLARVSKRYKADFPLTDHPDWH